MNQTLCLTVMGCFCVSLLGCGDDDDDGGQASVVVPAPALTPEHCPATPSEVSLDSVAPFWGGLVVVGASVGTGIADGFDVDVFDPTLGGWSRSYGTMWQTADGPYAMAVSTTVNEQNKDSEFKVRIRSRLAGCPPSEWAESSAYTLTDPLADTSWVATWEPANMAGGLTIERTDASEMALPPVSPELDGPITQTFAFAADGSFQETITFGLTAEAGEPFDGCSFVLHYGGTWSISFQRYSLNLLVSDRVPAENPMEGSTCALPALEELALSDTTRSAQHTLGGGLSSAPSDYSGLLTDPPGPVRMENYELTNSIRSEIFFGLNYQTATERGQFAASFDLEHSVFVKQAP